MKSKCCFSVDESDGRRRRRSRSRSRRMTTTTTMTTTTRRTRRNTVTMMMALKTTAAAAAAAAALATTLLASGITQGQALFPSDSSSTSQQFLHILQRVQERILSPGSYDDATHENHPGHDTDESIPDSFESNGERPSSAEKDAKGGPSASWRGHDRERNQRRALFELALNSHYMSFLDVGGKEDENGDDDDGTTTMRWTDPRTKCPHYKQTSNDFWTYYFCPDSHVGQVRYEPKKINDDGTVVEYTTASRYSMGRLKQEANVTRSSRSTDTTATTSTTGNRGERYTNGDVCVGTNVKRQTLVIYEDSKTTCKLRKGQTMSILSVTEPKRCRYEMTVCVQSTPPSDAANTTNTGGVEIDDQILQDVQNIIKSYFHQSGVELGTMTMADRTTSLAVGLPVFPPSRKAAVKTLVKEMFTHAYDSYMYNAYPGSELKPLSCKPGHFNLVRLPALTLIDTLDTLVLMDNFTEFARSVERLRLLDRSSRAAEAAPDRNGHKRTLLSNGIFDTNQNVSVFETNIRVLGGLLSAHQLAEAFLKHAVSRDDVWDEHGDVRIGPLPTKERPNPRGEKSSRRDGTHCTSSDGNAQCTASGPFEKKCGECVTSADETSFWEYDGFLLDLAHDIGKRLLRAFATRTGVPYGTVNLLHGIPRDETRIASLAGGGTLSLEFELLSRLTGDQSFGKAAKLATRALFVRRSTKNLLGKHVDVEKGEWTEQLSGIGSNSDSFYEYLMKHHITFPEDSDFFPMFLSAYDGIFHDTRLGEWYADVDMKNGSPEKSGRRNFESLMAFYPGLQILAGELVPAAKSANSFFLVREALGLLPERFNYGQWSVDRLPPGAGFHPLRPELLESAYFLHRATKSLGVGRIGALHSSRDDSSGWLWAADFAVQALQRLARVRCGYAVVKYVSASSTGTVPELGERNRRVGVNHGDEMPSFFLCETLKYLYLMFDDTNLLHQDDERQWTFTTEAHPVHHALPAKEDDNIMGTMKNDLRNMLLLRARRRTKGATRRDRSRSSLDDVHDQKWTDRTTLSMYKTAISQAEKVLHADNSHPPLAGEHARSLLDSKLFTQFRTDDGQHEDEKNLARLVFSPLGIGSGLSLTKACPNLSSSSFLWIYALNGGSLDYGDVYVSSVSDKAPQDARFGVEVLSALSALSQQGSGMYLGVNIQDDTNSCTMTLPTQEEPPKEEEERPPEGVQRFDLGGEVGAVDISVYAQGNGFYVSHVRSGETIVVTVVMDEEDKQDKEAPFVMVYAVLPLATSETKDAASTASWRLTPSGTWEAIFSRKKSNSMKKSETLSTNPEQRRSVVIAPSPNQTFVCSVEVVERKTHQGELFPQASCSEDELAFESETVISQYPCAPALFGPTAGELLVGQTGLSVESALHFDPSDELGCQEPQAEEGDVRGGIQLVRRGICPFQKKTLNQAKRHGVEGVIVVNNRDEDLFLMSGSEDKNAGKGAPVSVLITGHDGDDLLMKARTDDSNSLITRISVRPQQTARDDQGNVIVPSGFQDWPIVQTTLDSIQIHAYHGWGVHAVDRPVPSSNPADDSSNTQSQASQKREWQLFLIQHDIQDQNVD